jgi:hypothetical protein
MPADCLPSLKKLMVQCWDETPSVRPSFPVIVDALEKIIVDCAIDDELGRTLWKTYFFRKDQVMWVDEFVPVLAQFVGTPLPNPNKNESLFLAAQSKLIATLPWQCLNALAAEKAKGNEEPIVNLEKLGQLLNWFGPLKETDGSCQFLQRVQATLSQTWFHGNIDYDDSVHRLGDKAPGFFLIRFSSKEHSGCFTISRVNAKSKIMHQRVLHKPGGPFSLADGKITYASLIDLVEKNREALQLETPCPDSPYAYLFKEKININSSIYDETD